jgi:hypothetical protein
VAVAAVADEVSSWARIHHLLLLEKAMRVEKRGDVQPIVLELFTNGTLCCNNMEPMI